MTVAEAAQAGGVLVSALALLISIIVAVINRKTRTPADDQARLEFGVGIIEKQLEAAQKDRDAMRETEQYLREQLDKADTASAEHRQERATLRDIINTLEERLHEKDSLIAQYKRTLDALAVKIHRGDPITLSDVYGPSGTETTADLDNTQEIR